MRQRTLVVGLVTGLCLLVFAAPAAAGGWWSYPYLDREPVGAGETATAESEAFFSTTEEARRAREVPYYAYLVRGYDTELLRRAMGVAEPRRWWSRDPNGQAIRVGRIRFGKSDANVGVARARVEIPPGVSGRWSLMFCDEGCVNPMGHVIPAPLDIAADAGAAQTARRISALEARQRRAVVRLRGEVRRATANTVEAQADAVEAKAVARDLRRLVSGMAVDVQLLKAKQDAAPPLPGWVWGAGGLVLGAIVGAWAMRRRRPAVTSMLLETPLDDQDWEKPARPRIRTPG